MSSRNATREDFRHVISCMKQGTVDARTFITHRVGFSEVKDCFESWLSPSAGVIKAMASI
jgi:threonine dehydrogenase-like Zn-dependent dehydrogenase